MQVVTNNYEETQKAGEDFAKQLHGGDVVLLYGNLGDGKTIFMQGFAKGLGIEKRVISPTFIIVRKYDVKNNPDVSTLYHVDLYRTQTVQDLQGLGLPEILEETDAIVAIEWPEKLLSLSPKKYYSVTLETLDENTRKVTIERHE